MNSSSSYPLIGEPVYLAGEIVALMGDLVTLTGDLVALEGDTYLVSSAVRSLVVDRKGEEALVGDLCLAGLVL